MRKSVYLMVLTVVMLMSCGRFGGYDDRLLRADSLMPTAPDSSLSILQSIDPGRLSSGHDRALHALLLSQAYDKNYIDLTSDSIISIAVDYYANTEEYRYAMLAHYYHGRVFQNRKEYHKAIVEFSKAKQLIEYSDDYLTAGLVCSHLGDMYEEFYDFSKSAESYMVAAEYYKIANKHYHMLFALNDGSVAYINNAEYDKASDIINRILQEATDSCNHAMIQVGKLDLMSLYGLTGKYAELLDVFNNLITEYPDVKLRSSTYMDVARACAYTGLEEDADFYISKAWDVSFKKTDTILIQISSSDIYRHFKKYELALNSLREGVGNQISSIKIMLAQPVLTAERDLYLKELELNQKEKENMRLRLMLTVVIIVFAVFGGVYSMVKYIRRKRIEISEYLQTIVSLKDSIENNYIQNAQMSALVNNLFNEQFSLIGNIGKTLVDLQEDRVGQKMLYNKVNTIISKFEEAKTLEQLENIINQCKNDVMHKLRTEMPGLSKKEYQQMCYHYAGFPVSLIGFLMHEKNTTIYKRRERIKNKILVSNPVHLNELIEDVA